MTKVYMHADVSCRGDVEVTKKVIDKEVVDEVLALSSVNDDNAKYELEEKLAKTIGRRAAMLLCSLWLADEDELKAVESVWKRGMGFGVLTEEMAVGIGFTKDEASAKYADVASTNEEWED